MNKQQSNSVQISVTNLRIRRSKESIKFKDIPANSLLSNELKNSYVVTIDFPCDEIYLTDMKKIFHEKGPKNIKILVLDKESKASYTILGAVARETTIIELKFNVKDDKEESGLKEVKTNTIRIRIVGVYNITGKDIANNTPMIDTSIKEAKLHISEQSELLVNIGYKN